MNVRVVTLLEVTLKLKRKFHHQLTSPIVSRHIQVSSTLNLHIIYQYLPKHRLRYAQRCVIHFTSMLPGKQVTHTRSNLVETE